MNSKYEIIIYWSEEDKIYIGEVPELLGCMAHGRTNKSALKHTMDAITAWIETALELGDTAPEPKGRKLAYA